jgi:hypothetical protein
MIDLQRHLTPAAAVPNIALIKIIGRAVCYGVERELLFLTSCSSREIKSAPQTPA